MTTRARGPHRNSRSTPPAASTPASPPASGSRSDPAAERLAYSVDEAARLTGLSRDLLYDEMRRGNLAFLKVGRRRLITRQHLEQFLGIIPGAGRPGGSPASTRRAGADAP